MQESNQETKVKLIIQHLCVESTKILQYAYVTYLNIAP